MAKGFHADADPDPGSSHRSGHGFVDSFVTRGAVAALRSMPKSRRACKPETTGQGQHLGGWWAEAKPGRYRPILLQKFQIAERQFFRQKARQAVSAD
jgi:hypothetical protein